MQWRLSASGFEACAEVVDHHIRKEAKMSRKFVFALIAPVLAVAAFVVMPAMASAAPAWYLCLNLGEGNGKYTNQHCNVLGGEEAWEWMELKTGESAMITSHGTTSFSLVTGPNTITCTTLKDEGTITGGRPGTDTTTLHFSGCSLNGVCPINPISGTVSSALEGAGPIFDRISINPAAPFVIEGTAGSAPCPEGPIGIVTGSAAGEVNGSKLVFAAVGGLEFNGEPSTIEGTDVQETLEGGLVTAKN